MNFKENIVLGITAITTGFTSIFGAGGDRANANEITNPPAPPENQQLHKADLEESVVDFSPTRANPALTQDETVNSPRESAAPSRSEQQQQVEGIQKADLNEVILTEEEYQALLVLWQETNLDTDLMTELQQGIVSELLLDFNSESLSSLPPSVSEKVLKLRVHLEDLVAEYAPNQAVHDIFQLKLAFSLNANNQIELFISATNYQGFSLLKSGSGILWDSQNEMRFIAIEEGDYATGYLKVDQQTVNESASLPIIMPDGSRRQLQLKLGDVIFCSWTAKNGRAEIDAFLIEGTALGLGASRELWQQLGYGPLTTPEPGIILAGLDEKKVEIPQTIYASEMSLDFVNQQPYVDNPSPISLESQISQTGDQFSGTIEIDGVSWPKVNTQKSSGITITETELGFNAVSVIGNYLGVVGKTKVNSELFDPNGQRIESYSFPDLTLVNIAILVNGTTVIFSIPEETGVRFRTIGSDPHVPPSSAEMIIANLTPGELVFADFYTFPNGWQAYLENYLYPATQSVDHNETTKVLASLLEMSDKQIQTNLLGQSPNFVYAGAPTSIQAINSSN